MDKFPGYLRRAEINPIPSHITQHILLSPVRELVILWPLATDVRKFTEIQAPAEKPKLLFVNLEEIGFGVQGH